MSKLRNIRLNKKSFIVFIALPVLLLLGLFLSGDGQAAAKKVLTFQDIMKFKEIQSPQISTNGDWVVYQAKPDRGNSQVVVCSVAAGTSRQIDRGCKPALTKDGKWAAALVEADVLELENASEKEKKKLKEQLVLLETATGQKESIENVKDFVFSDDSLWLAYLPYPVDEENDAKEKKEPDKDKKEKKEKKEKSEWAKKTGPLVIRHLPTRKETRFENVLYFAVDPSSRWLAYSTYQDDEETGAADNTNPTTSTNSIDSTENTGSKNSENSKNSKNSENTQDGKKAGNGMFVFNLQVRPMPAEAETKAQTWQLMADTNAVFNNLAWSKKSSRLAFLFHHDQEKLTKNNQQADTLPSPGTPAGSKSKTGKSNRPGLWIFDGVSRKLAGAVLPQDIPAGWMLPAENRFTWTKDGERLFFGLKPLPEYEFYHAKNAKKAGEPTVPGGTGEQQKEEEKAKTKITEKEFFDSEYLLKKRKVDVWHWQDAHIQPQQEITWEMEKKRTYTAVYHLQKKRSIQLADQTVPRVNPVENGNVILAFSDLPYRRETTWDDHYEDVYLVNLGNGSRQQLLTRFDQFIALSPGGQYAVYYKDKNWFLYDTGSGSTRNLTAAIDNPFFDEDHDYPSAVPGCGIAGWLENDQAVLIYDKYDIWQFSTATAKGVNLSNGMGRKEQLTFRVIQTDPEQDFYKADEQLLLSAYSQEEKFTAFYSCSLGKKIKGKPAAEIKQLLGGEKRYTFVAKAENADRCLFTRESFEEFPDLWAGDMGFISVKKISDVNPQVTDFLWGKARLVEWDSMDGTRLQGVVIVPENYRENQRYPVLVYFYRFFSDRLYEFNQMVVNHRPNFPFYASNGYVLFLPDVRFQVGQPGYSAAKCIVPGVQKLIDLGIANPQAIALHGHSWSGYQTAYIITRTDIFAAAIAGAPVSNMTSAYSGIRWGSGMARQFQYEKSQSRIGASLWEAPQLYIENSPVFYADRIHTPLLIEHGDQDEAVPWYQAIELYLAMRRLNKPCIYLQYNGEMHHLKSYANKLDYSIKMKEFLDHYLKGAPAPQWMREGIPYQKTGETEN